jgi:hypothetical protein
MTEETDLPGGPELNVRERAPCVFVSYSHRDEQVLEALLPYLATLQRDGLVTVWSDQHIEAGEQWRKEIDVALDAATIAVLLISQEFLTSKFVRDEELPRILAQQGAGQMTVLPVFVSPSTVHSDSVLVPHAEGKERRIMLTEFQGFGSPDETLSELPPPERQRLFVELHDRIRALATATPITASPEPDPLSSPVARGSIKKERSTPEQRFPLGTTIAGIGTIVAILLGILGWRSMSFNDAVTQFESGSSAGSTALAVHGDKGIRILIDGLDATGESKPAFFPRRTLGILQILRERPEAVDKHRRALDAEASKNRMKLEGLATTIEAHLEKNLAVDPEELKQLEDVAHVAVCMNRLLGSEQPGWSELAIRVRILLRELPPC